MRAIPVGLVLCLAPAAARAVGEGERQIAAQAAYIQVLPHERGAYFAVEGQYGLTDAWAGRLEAGVSHEGRLFWGAAGVTYAWDVLRVVPFVDVAVTGAGGRDGALLGGVAGLGAEYLVTRRWAIAAVGRWRTLAVLSGDRDAPAHAFTAGLRLGYVF